MILTQGKRDRLFDALIIGMAAADAYIYAGLTPTEIENIAEDTEIQALISQRSKEFEYSLLKRMNDISQKQAKVGRETATAWMLEKMYPRYSGKPQTEGGDIHLHFNDSDPAKMDTVEIHKGREDGQQ
jgi:hypothetical protein